MKYSEARKLFALVMIITIAPKILNHGLDSLKIIEIVFLSVIFIGEIIIFILNKRSKA